MPERFPPTWQEREGRLEGTIPELEDWPLANRDYYLDREAEVQLTPHSNPNLPLPPDWPLHGRDYITDREDQWIWLSELPNPLGLEDKDVLRRYNSTRAFEDWLAESDYTEEEKRSWNRLQKGPKWREENPLTPEQIAETAEADRIHAEKAEADRIEGRVVEDGPAVFYSRVQNYDNGGGVNTLPEDQEVPISGIASFVPGPGGADFPIPPTYIGSSDTPGFDVLSEGTEAYENLPIWKQIALGVTPVGVMADIMMAAKYGRDAVEDLIASRYGDAAVAASMTALATVGFIPGVGDAVKIGGQKLLRRLGVPEPKVKWHPDMSPEEKTKWFKQYSEDPRLGGDIRGVRGDLDLSIVDEWRARERLRGPRAWSSEEIPTLHWGDSWSSREGIEKLLPERQARQLRNWRQSRQRAKTQEWSPSSDEASAYRREKWRLEDQAEWRRRGETDRAFRERLEKIGDDFRKEFEIEGETLGEYVPTLDEELDNVVDFPRRGGIETLIDPNLLKQRRYLLEKYGLDDAGLVRLTKEMQEYAETGVLHGDFSNKLTPNDLRDITSILEGGNPWEPGNFAYGGGVNSLYIDQGVPVNGIASFRPSV